MFSAELRASVAEQRNGAWAMPKNPPLPGWPQRDSPVVYISDKCGGTAGLRRALNSRDPSPGGGPTAGGRVVGTRPVMHW